MKPYPPTLREKRRYLSFKVHAKMGFTENQVKHSLLEAVSNLLGEKGVGMSDFKIVEYDENTMSGIIRTTNESTDDIIFAMSLIKDVQGKNAWCEIISSSGTIKACKKYAAPEKKEDKIKEKLERNSAEIMKYSKN